MIDYLNITIIELEPSYPDLEPELRDWEYLIWREMSKQTGLILN